MKEREQASAHQEEAKIGTVGSRPALEPRPAAPHTDLLTLQRTAGNRVVGRLLRGRMSGGEGPAPWPLRIGAVHDPAEREADSVADEVMERSDMVVRRSSAAAGGDDDCPGCGDKPPAIRRKASAGGGQAAAPRVVHQALRQTGRPLDAGLRQSMESRFGTDLGGVRVHTGDLAGESAAAVGARAYTVGQDVVFGEGEYAPHTRAGQRLLAHELAHVIQGGGIGHTLYRQQSGGTKAEPEMRRYQIKIPPGTTTLQELYRYAETVIFGRVINHSWQPSEGLVNKFNSGTARPGTTITVSVHASLLAAAGSPPAAEKRAEQAAAVREYAGLEEGGRLGIDAEIDRRYFASVEDPTHTAIRAGESGKIAIWNSFRQQVLADRRKLNALPQGIKDILGPSESYRPEDYATLNRIADKLLNMSAADLEDYRSKINASTTDLAVLEASIDRYLAERERRRAQTEEREKIKSRLYGDDIKALYHTYKEWKSLKGSANMVPSRDEFGVADPNAGRIRQARDDAYQRLTSQLPRHGFNSVAAFEAAIADYERAFRKETVDIALDRLARYEHVLYEARKWYGDPGHVTALVQSVSATQARAGYQEALREKSAARSIRPDPDLHRYLPGELRLKQEHEEKARAAHARAEAEVASATQGQPLIQARDFDRQRLALAAGEGAVRTQLFDYIAEHEQAIKEARADLADDSELVYRFDTLMQASFKEQGIDPNSLYYEIVRDQMRDLAGGRILKAIILTVVAIAATIATAGTGAVAVAGGVTLLGVGAYQAYEAYREYEIESSASKADLLSNDPLFFWVVVAVLGVGLDLATVGAALKAMRATVEAFNATGDIVQLEKSLVRLKELGEINAAIEQNVLKAARAELQYRRAVGEIFASGGKLRAVVVPFAEEFGRFVVAAYYLAKRGVVAFERFLLDLKAQKLIGEIKDLSPENLTLLKKAFEEGLEKSKTGLIDASKLSDKVRGFYGAEQVEEVAARGKALGLDDSQINNWLERGVDGKKSVARLQDEMAGAVETQRLTKSYEKLSDQQLRDLLKTDPDAPFELLRRYRLKSEEELRQLAKDGDETARLVRQERSAALREARTGTRTAPADQPVWDRLHDRLIGKRTVTPKTPETGTLGVAETDLPLPNRQFEGGSIKTGEVPDPTYPPPTQFPRAQGHAEQNILGKLKQAIVDAGLDKTPGALQGKKVWILVDQEVCTGCRTGLMSDLLQNGKPSGVLKQFSQDFPELTIEVTDWGTGKVWRLLNGKPVKL